MVITGSTTRRRSVTTGAQAPPSRGSGGANSGGASSGGGTPAKRKRGGGPGRPGRTAANVSLHAKEQHDLEAAAVSDGLDQLDKIVAALQRLRDGGPLPDAPGLPREWNSPETLFAMTEVIDENPRPTLEYVLGVLGATAVPKRLAERQRSQGARAFTAHLRNRAIRRKREAMEERTRKAKEAREAEAKSALEKQQDAKGAKAEQHVEPVEEKRSASDPKHEGVEPQKTAPAPSTGADASPAASSPPPTGAAADRQHEHEKPAAEVATETKKTISAAPEPATQEEVGANLPALEARSPPSSTIAVKKEMLATSAKADRTPASAPEQPEVAAEHQASSDDEHASLVKAMQDATNIAGQSLLAEKRALDAGQPVPMDVDAVEEEQTDANMQAAESQPPVDKVALSGASEDVTEHEPEPVSATEVREQDVPMKGVDKVAAPTDSGSKPSQNVEVDGLTVDATAVKTTEEPGIGRGSGGSGTKRGVTIADGASEAVSEAVSEHSRGSDENKTNSEKQELNVLAPETKQTAVSTPESHPPPTPQQDSQQIELSKSGDEDTKKLEEVQAAETKESPRKAGKTPEEPAESAQTSAAKSTAVDAEALEKKPAAVDTSAKGGNGQDRPDKEQTNMLKNAGNPSTEARPPADTQKLTVPPRKAISPRSLRDKGDKEAKLDVQPANTEPVKSDTIVPISKKAEDKQDEPKEAPSKANEDVKPVVKSEPGSVKQKTIKKTEHRAPKKRFQERKEDHEEVDRDATEAPSKEIASAPKLKSKESRDGPKVRKSKEKEKVPERRVGSRRLSYFREDLVHPHAPKTRLRRESSHLRDPSSLPADTDPFIVDCFHIWKTINQDKITIPFRKPVTVKDAPNYFDVVKNPMDLSTVRKQLEDKTIKTPEDFYAKMLLICSNATLFNDADSDLYELAQELRQKIKKAVKPVLKDWRASVAAAKKESGSNKVSAAASNASAGTAQVRKLSESSSDSRQSSESEAEASVGRGTARYPPRRGSGSAGGSGHTASGRPTSTRGRKKYTRGRGKATTRGGHSRRMQDWSDDDDDDVVTIPPPRGRRGSRGGRGGAGRRGGAARDALSSARKGKRGRPPVEEEPEEGRKKRRISVRKRREDD